MDVFSELSIYKGRIKTQLSIKLYQASMRMVRKAKVDKKEGTEVSNVHKHRFAYFKKDEWDKMIQLDSVP